MSKMKKEIENRVNEENVSITGNGHKNFMGGISYALNPIETLKMITASSIFGEPQYYRAGEFAKAGIKEGINHIHRLFRPYMISGLFQPYVVSATDMDGLKTSDVMERVIDAALDYDFKATIEWAAVLRNQFYMRLNPQVIMVRAAMHPAREKFTAANPGMFAEINNSVMSRADEPAVQLTYYLYRKGSKASVPNLLKRSWAKRIERMSKYDICKYRNKEVGLIDTVRVCHAHNAHIDALMKTGTIEMPEEEKTWETLRASGKSWKEILDTIKIGHMALLRNLRGIFSEINDIDYCEKILQTLKNGVLTGKQYPFRYYAAMHAVEESDVNHKSLILDALEECMNIACENMPKLNGKTMCLSDNSGSAWGAIPSEYGSVTIAEIDNLSSVIAARNSQDGYVGKFGDKLITIPVKKTCGVLSQSEEISDREKYSVGGATENGIWVFFDNAIKNKEHWDNIFIYSDQQAGHGGLFGINPENYAEFSADGRYIDVAKLIDVYRRTVNPKVNVYSIQTAGYNDVLIPENGYRTTVLYGWTGKELVYADVMNKFWDEVDERRQQEEQQNSPT